MKFSSFLNIYTLKSAFRSIQAAYIYQAQMIKIIELIINHFCIKGKTSFKTFLVKLIFQGSRNIIARSTMITGYFIIFLQIFQEKVNIFLSKDSMSSKNIQRQRTPNSYKLIHAKNTPTQTNKVLPFQYQKSSEYFPAKMIKREVNYLNLDHSSSNTSNKEFSQSDRYHSRQSNISTTVRQDNKVLQKQVQKLRKEIKKYEKIILERQEKSSSIRKLEIQLVETYRVIQYYEGKIKQLQKMCNKYQISFNDNEYLHSSRVRVSDLIQQLRKDNVEMGVQLQNKKRSNYDYMNKISELSSKKVQLQQKIKQLSKQTPIVNHNLLTFKPKFVDDYEKEHLQVSNSKQYIKKRPIILSRNKKTIKVTSGQSSSQQSNLVNEYRSNIYTKRQKKDESRDKDSSSGRLRSKMFGNISSKLNNIEKQLQSLKKQNEKLQQTLDIKINEILSLKTQNQELLMKISETEQLKKVKQQQNMPQKIVISKNMIKQISKPQTQKHQNKFTNTITSLNTIDNKLSSFVSNISQIKSNSSHLISSNSEYHKENKSNDKNKAVKKTTYKFNEIKQKTLIKLTINLTKSQVSYDELISLIAESWSSEDPNKVIEELETSPYNLNSQETAEFMFEYKQIIKYISSKESEQATKDFNQGEYKKYLSEQIKKVLEDNIVYFKNITFRRDFTLNIQIANKFKNYQDEFEEIVAKYGNKMPYKQCENVLLKSWGMSQQQFTSLVSKHYEDNGELQLIQIQDIGRFYLKD